MVQNPKEVAGPGGFTWLSRRLRNPEPKRSIDQQEQAVLITLLCGETPWREFGGFPLPIQQRFGCGCTRGL
eukprot:6461630-Amphidinium_carterae.2